jgi:hypothetical protein
MNELNTFPLLIPSYNAPVRDCFTAANQRPFLYKGGPVLWNDTNACTCLKFCSEIMGHSGELFEGERNPTFKLNMAFQDSCIKRHLPHVFLVLNSIVSNAPHPHHVCCIKIIRMYLIPIWSEVLHVASSEGCQSQ